VVYTISYTQTLSPKDSINFKHNFEALLKKYKLDNKGYKINVQSNNQSGGQTAFIITNNYYKDPNLIPDSLNYVSTITIEKGRKVLTVYPKSGSWIQPILFYDTSDVDIKLKIYPVPNIITSYSATLSNKAGILKVKGIVFPMACSISQPIHIYLNDKPAEFYYFGDNADLNKRFFYSKGKIIWDGRN
jgi:hypothetical protein